MRELGPVGVWLYAGRATTVEEERTLFTWIDRLGYGSLWYGEGSAGGTCWCGRRCVSPRPNG